MKKARFKYYLKNDEMMTEFEDNCFYYEDRNVLAFNEQDGTQVFIDLNHFLLTRENNEMFLLLDFNETGSYVEMKKMNKKLELELKLNKKELKNNKFMVNYTLSGQNNFEFIIDWTLGGE